MRNINKSVEQAINALQNQKLVLLTDDTARENEADFIFPAEKINPAVMNFIIRNSSGIVCLAMNAEKMQQLGLSLMVNKEENTSQYQTPFTVSIDASKGITTGVSAQDRVETILRAVSPCASPKDIAKPGHVFPLLAKAGGVFERKGHTEGAVDLVRLAGFSPSAILCEAMNGDGSMMRGKSLLDFSEKEEIPIISIQDLWEYRLRNESLIAEITSTILPIENYGNFMFHVVREKYTLKEHMILEKETSNQKPLVRVHSACATGDLFGSLRCDCQKQFHYALKKIAQEGGYLFYLQQEGRGIGLWNKIKAYALQEKNRDTIQANQDLGLAVDNRRYYLPAHFLKNRKIKAIRLLTENKRKIQDLIHLGSLNVLVEQMPAFENPHNQHYLQVKKVILHDIVEI